MSNPLKIAICEDMNEDTAHLRQLIQESGFPVQVEHYKNGEDFVKVFARGQYDLLLLDIYLEDMSGIEVAEAVREKDKHVVIIFTTGSEDFTRESYRLNAYKYIMKPIAQEDVRDALELARLKRDQYKGDVCTVVTKSEPVQIPLNDIYYVEASKATSIIHITEGNIETHLLFSDLERLLPPPRFLRCHRAYIVNLDYVEGINDQGDFIMKNGDSVLVRVRDGRKMKAVYMNYIVQTTRDTGE